MNTYALGMLSKRWKKNRSDGGHDEESVAQSGGGGHARFVRDLVHFFALRCAWAALRWACASRHWLAVHAACNVPALAAILHSATLHQCPL